MDFENERYVRNYTRDTTAGLMMAWDEHALFFALKRKVDRAGILDLDGYGAGGLVPHLRCPVDVAERALAAWIRAGWVEIHGDLLLIPDHIEAEEARQSDAQRKRNSREQHRAKARLRSVLGVTECDPPSQLPPSSAPPVTPPALPAPPSATPDSRPPSSHPVTNRDAPSPEPDEPDENVTPGHTRSPLPSPTLPDPYPTRADDVARARDTPTPTSPPGPMDLVDCEVCGGAGRTDRWGRCRTCSGQGRHLAGGVDEKTLALARAIARYLPEVNPSQADRLLHVWTDRHTPENVEHAIRQCAAELSEETPPDKALRLLRVFVENAPSHHDRHEGRRRNANGRDAERAHDATKTPEELRRRGRRVRRDPDAEAAKERERLALAATAAKQALAAIGNGGPGPKSSRAPSSAQTSEPEQENPDHATEPHHRDAARDRPRPARAPTDDASRTARPPTEGVGDGGGDHPSPPRERQARGGGGDHHPPPPHQGGGDDPAPHPREGEGRPGRGARSPRGDGAAQAQPQEGGSGDARHDAPQDPKRAEGG